MRWIYALGLCVGSMRSTMRLIYVLDLCAWSMRWIHALDLCAQSMRSMHALDPCAETTWAERKQTATPRFCTRDKIAHFYSFPYFFANFGTQTHFFFVIRTSVVLQLLYHTVYGTQNNLAYSQQYV